MPDDGRPKRHYPAQGVYFPPNEVVIVFVTVCTKDRVPWLANERVHRLLREVWSDEPQWMVGRYVIMPDHVHLFASPAPESTAELKNWIRYWKSAISKRIEDKHCRWQLLEWATRLRTSKSYDSKWAYVAENPVRHKLVTDSKDWPYQGQLNDLQLHR